MNGEDRQPAPPSDRERYEEETPSDPPFKLDHAYDKPSDPEEVTLFPSGEEYGDLDDEKESTYWMKMDIENAFSLSEMR